MYSSKISVGAAALLSIAQLAHSQTPPGFSPSTSNTLSLTFGSISITPGLQIGIDVPVNPPTFSTPNALPSQTYLLTIVDPDASTPQNPTVAQFLHYLGPNIVFPTNSTAVATAAPIAPYVQPSPPVYSDPHRYIALLFAQPANFTVPADFAGYSAANRTLFNIAAFAAEAGLGAPLEANYFLVSNMTGSLGAGVDANTTVPVASGTASATGVGSATATGSPIPSFTGAAVVGKSADLGAFAVAACGFLAAVGL
ncbi:hypothetical protein MMC25_007457 [Agyrium rufum]|nr:hypothetical protein [Agyrium rufum]